MTIWLPYVWIKLFLSLSLKRWVFFGDHLQRWDWLSSKWIRRVGISNYSRGKLGLDSNDSWWVWIFFNLNCMMSMDIIIRLVVIVIFKHWQPRVDVVYYHAFMCKMEKLWTWCVSGNKFFLYGIWFKIAHLSNPFPHYTVCDIYSIFFSHLLLS